MEADVLQTLFHYLSSHARYALVYYLCTPKFGSFAKKLFFCSGYEKENSIFRHRHAQCQRKYTGTDVYMLQRLMWCIRPHTGCCGNFCRRQSRGRQIRLLHSCHRQHCILPPLTPSHTAVRMVGQCEQRLIAIYHTKQGR